MWKLTVAAALLLALAWNAPARASRKGALGWHCPELTALHFVRKSDLATGMGAIRFADTALMVRPDLTEAGMPVSQEGGVFSPAQYVLRVASPVAGRKDSWKATFDNTKLPGALDSLPDKLTGAYALASLKDGVATYKFEVAGDDGDADPVAGNRVIKKFSIEGTASFDTEKGWLTGVKGEWKAKGYMGPVSTPFEYRLDVSKSFKDRAALDKAVADAIEKGLKAVDGLEDYWGHRADYASLAAYTYLHGGRAMSDKFTAEALSKMTGGSKVLPFIQMYHAGAQALAIESKYISDAERKLVAQGKSPSEFKRALTPEDRDLMKKIVDWIASKQEKDNMGLLSYGQSPGQRPDLSNTQFAALALGAASRCGVEIPVGLVRDMGNAVAGFQQDDGPEVWRVKDRKKNGKWVYERYPDKARGFTYTLPTGKQLAPGAPYGSMTAAGVCTMLMLLDIYDAFDSDRRKQEMSAADAKKWERRVEAGAHCGIAWLQYHFTVCGNPLHVGINMTNYCYYLYALERVGAFSTKEYIGEHSWYEEGAIALLAQQLKDGSWGSFEDTCFALLFLSRATTPTRRVLTGH